MKVRIFYCLVDNIWLYCLVKFVFSNYVIFKLILSFRWIIISYVFDLITFSSFSRWWEWVFITTKSWRTIKSRLLQLQVSTWPKHSHKLYFVRSEINLLTFSLTVPRMILCSPIKVFALPIWLFINFENAYTISRFSSIFHRKERKGKYLEVSQRGF